jgi:hypothetical protein
MPTTQLQLRRGNTAQTAIFTGAVGEVTVDTDKKTLIVHDGVTSGGTEISLKTRTDSAYNQANTATTNAATANQRAVTSGSYANSAYAQANTVSSDLNSANTWLQTYVNTQVSNLIDSAPVALDTLNELAAALNDDSNFSTTITNMVGVSGSYANSAFGAANTADQRAVTSGSYANSAFGAANTAITNAANADQRAVTSGDYANSAYSQANTGTILAQAAFDSANNVAPQIQPSFDQANTANQSATSAGSYANSAFAAANTADQRAVTSGLYANSAFAGANTATANASTADQKAVTSGSYANSAFAGANTADQRAVTSGDYANSAFAGANTATANASTADQKAVTSGSYANAAFAAANTADQKAVTSGDYANSAYLQANTGTILAQAAFDSANNVAPQIQPAFNSANSAGSFANSAYTQANTATTNAATADQRAVTSGDYANSAYAHANTKFSSSGGTISGNVTVGTFVDFTTGLSDPSYKEGRVYYDSGSKSLAYYNDDSQSYIHVGQDLVTRVWNNSGVTLPRANCVFISGTSSANGFPSVSLASAAVTANSEVIGLTTGDIAPGAYGFVLMSGRIQGLNTSTIPVGVELFLSATEPGKFTSLVPDSPNVPLNIGYITRSDLTDGTLLVNIHLMEGSNKNDGSILFARNGKIDQDNNELFWDYANNKLGIGTNNPTANLHVVGSGLFTGNVTISGNLFVSNAQSITTSELTVGGNTIILNSEVTGTPTSNADIIVNRGTSPNVYIRWSETINEWVMYEDAGYAEGHILHSEKTAKTWADYTAMAAYEKSTHPIGAGLANNTNEHAKSGFQVANTASAHAVSGFIQANSAYISQNTTGSYANSAYLQANTATTNAVTADQRAVTSGSYANSAFARANTSLINNDSTSTTGILFASGLVSNTSVTLNTSSVITSTGITTSTLSQVTADSWSSSTYRSAKYFVQITSGSSYHVLEMSVLHDGTTVYMVTYGEQFTGSSLGNFGATVSGGLLSLLFTPTNASTSVRINKTLMVV